MFGQNDNTQQSNDDPAMLDNVKQLATQPADQVSTAPVGQPMTPPAPADSPAATPAPDPATAHAEPAQGFTNAPIDDPAAIPDTPSAPVASSEPKPPAEDPAPIVIPSPTDNSSDDSSTDTPAADPEHLAGLKQEALGHLEPLTDHIDGTPEETFKTTMMMIQANDNHTLLEKALEAAKKIEDDKVRAQALLDIINEINYFASIKE